MDFVVFSAEVDNPGLIAVNPAEVSTVQPCWQQLYWTIIVMRNGKKHIVNDTFKVTLDKLNAALDNAAQQRILRYLVARFPPVPAERP